MSTALQPEIEILPETNSDWVNDLSDEACRLHDTAVEAYRGGRPDEAEGLFRRALAIFEQAEGPEHLDVAAVLGNLGALLEDQCDYPAAEECYVRAAAITEAIEDDPENYDDDEDVARLRLLSLDILGRIYRTQGRNAEAEPVIRRAFEFAERAFGSESIEASGALNNLGMLGEFAGWFDEAEDCYRADSSRRTAGLILLTAPPLGVLLAWFAMANVALYETTDAARLEIDSAVRPVEAVVGGRVAMTRLAVIREVKGGDVLVELETESQRLQLAEEQARVAALKAQLAALRL